MSGVTGSVVRSLENIEDEGNREVKQVAMTLVAESQGVSSQNIPVNFQIISLKAKTGVTESNLTAIPGTGSYSLVLRVSLVDNPKNVNLTGVRLEVTDSRTGQILHATGDILARQVNVIETSDTILLGTGQSGIFRCVLDPDRAFSIIDRNEARFDANYTVL